MKKTALLLSIFALFVTIGTTKCEAATGPHVIEISEKIMPQAFAAYTDEPYAERPATPREVGDWQVKYKAPSGHAVNKAAKDETAKEKKCPKNKCLVNDYAEPPAPVPAYVPLDPDIEALDAQKGGKCCKKCACNPDCDCGENCTCSKKHRCSKDCSCNKASCQCEKNCKCKEGKCKCDKTVCKCKKCAQKQELQEAVTLPARIPGDLPEQVEAVVDPESTPDDEVIDIIEVPEE